MNREELYEEYSNQYPLIMGFREVTYEDWLQKQVIDLRTNKPLPPAEGAEAQRCPVCMGKGLVPNSFYATTSGIGSTTQTYLPEKCRTCNGAGVILPSYLQKQQQSTAEGAEEILASLIESLGEPINIHNHIFEIRPYTVEHKTEWWIFHKEVESGEPLTQWLSKFATLHAQRLAEKMVEKKWINVKDRLPEKDGKSSIYCLVNSEYDGIVVRPYNEYHECWDTEDADDYYCDAIGGKITHWMPLPNPPIE